MFPYRDENETQRTAIVTLAMIALNVLAWLFVQGAGSTLALAQSVCNFGLIPGELTGSIAPGTQFPMGEGLACATDPGRQLSHVFTHMFLHGSWLHLLGNMWFLWLFGNNVEDSMGHARYLIFYLACGIAAAMTQALMNPDSTIPMVGASGAISGVLGAYVLLHPHATVRVLIFIGVFATIVHMPALIVLGLWFLTQFVSAAFSQAGGPGVAFWAHVGGFVAGMVLVPVLKQKGVPLFQPAHSRPF